MPKVLFLTAYPVEDASCRYRVHQFVPYLERAGYHCTISTFATPRLFRAITRKGAIRARILDGLYCSVRRLARLRDLSSFDFVIIHREAFPFFAPYFENVVFNRHKKVIFSFDDAIYAGHEDASKLTHPTLYRWKHGHGYDEVIRRSAQIIVGNRILADYALKWNPNVSIIPTVVDTRQYWFKPVDSGHSRLTIGWIGSPSTSPYLSLIEPALRRLAAVHADKVQFRFYGDTEYKLNVPEFSSRPFRLDSEIDDLHSFDIGLMPLSDTEWTRGKCAFKAIQYMAAGVPTVASPVGITTDLIQDGVNGFLASSADEWFTALDRLVRDAELRRRIAVAARQTIEDSYSLDVWWPRFVALLDQLRVRASISQRETVAA